MLIVDVSNLAHIGINGRRTMNYNDVGLKAIPFIISKVVGMMLDTEEVMFAFDPKADGKKMDYFRTYNPQVVFEVNVLYDLLKHIGFNVLRVPGISADDIICNIADFHKNTSGKKTILTEDRDLVSAVYLDDATGGTVEILGPTVNGDHITPFNMYSLTSVPYNFMNVFKTIMGCKSDRIPSLSGGSILWKDFLSHIAKKKFQIRGKVEIAYQHIDVHQYNTKEYLLNWLESKGVDGTDNAEHVYSKTLDKRALGYKQVDWQKFNQMFGTMFGVAYTNRRRGGGRADQEMLNFIAKTIIDNGIQDATVFEPIYAYSPDTIMDLEDFNVEV